MGGSSRIAVIDGAHGMLGHLRQGVECRERKTLQVLTTRTRDEETIAVQLKREILSQCTIGKLSAQFSYPKNIEGRNLVIWCTGGKGGFNRAFYGTVERVSHKTELEFALRIKRKASAKECYSFE